jgi:hypothetical protein
MEMKTLRQSTITGLLTLGFTVSPLFLAISTPEIFYEIVYAGMFICSLLTFYSWRRERRKDPSASSVGIWIVVIALLLFVLLDFILPIYGGKRL